MLDLYRRILLVILKLVFPESGKEYAEDRSCTQIYDLKSKSDNADIPQEPGRLPVEPSEASPGS